MDPQACFKTWCDAVKAGDKEASRDAGEDYNAWIARGGFPANDAQGRIVQELSRAGYYSRTTPGARMEFQPL